MQFNRQPTRYTFFDAKTQSPVLSDDGKKDKKPAPTPKKDVDQDDGDDLKHVDQSKGGYGHGSGFDQDK